MSREKEEVPQEVENMVTDQTEGNLLAAAMAEKWQLIELKSNMLTMAKEILERNAALQWEQDKTTGLSISHEEIISVAKDILDFVLE